MCGEHVGAVGAGVIGGVVVKSRHRAPWAIGVALVRWGWMRYPYGGGRMVRALVGWGISKGWASWFRLDGNKSCSPFVSLALACFQFVLGRLLANMWRWWRPMSPHMCLTLLLKTPFICSCLTIWRLCPLLTRWWCWVTSTSSLAATGSPFLM